jgi:uncharacterized protein YggU (UPF0235/DUF167 family)
LSRPWRPTADGVEVALKVTPHARRAAIAGRADDADGRAWLLAQVTAAPESGRANAAVVALLAEALGVAPSACEFVAGAASRRKRVRVSGDPAALDRALAALTG